MPRWADENVLIGFDTADDAGVYTTTGTAGTIFANVASLTFDNGATTYDVDAPDTVGPLNGSVVCMKYTATATPGAAVQWLRDNLKMISNAAETEEIAQSVADTGGVYFVPAFNGLFAPHWDMYA